MGRRVSPAEINPAGLVWLRILSELRLLLNRLERRGSKPAIAGFGGDGALLLFVVEHFAILFAIGIDQRPAFRLRKRQLSGLGIIVNDHEIPGFDLLRRDKVRNRIDKEALDRTLQVARAVFEIDPLIQEKLLRLIGALENELLTGEAKKFLLDERSEEHTSELQSPDHLVCR